ncbi:MAG: hypothetical protein K2Q01_02570, partial [Rickettsiales bacterium]|nr:hypothetical protein [Rickettsiales bacterium]
MSSQTPAPVTNVRQADGRGVSNTPERVSQVFNPGTPNGGTYFDFTRVGTVADQLTLPPLLDTAVKDNKGPVLDAAAKLLDEKYGIKRMSFFAQGSSSMVFTSVPDAAGRMQLVTLTPVAVNGVGYDFIPHPAMLPDKASHIV